MYTTDRESGDTDKTCHPVTIFHVMWEQWTIAIFLTTHSCESLKMLILYILSYKPARVLY